MYKHTSCQNIAITIIVDISTFSRKVSKLTQDCRIHILQRFMQMLSHMCKLRRYTYADGHVSLCAQKSQALISSMPSLAPAPVKLLTDFLGCIIKLSVSVTPMSSGFSIPKRSLCNRISTLCCPGLHEFVVFSPSAA